jgi:ribosomal protein S27AE
LAMIEKSEFCDRCGRKIPANVFARCGDRWLCSACWIDEIQTFCEEDEF